MEIFYANINELVEKKGTDFLKNYSGGMIFKTEKGFLQYCTGRFIVDKVCRSRYNLNDFEIIIKNKKPQLKNNVL